MAAVAISSADYVRDQDCGRCEFSAMVLDNTDGIHTLSRVLGSICVADCWFVASIGLTVGDDPGCFSVCIEYEIHISRGGGNGDKLA